MSTDQQAKLGRYTTPEPDGVAEPSGDNEPAERASSAPHGSVESLAEIFHSVVGEYETVEEQQETPSHEPVEGGETDVPDLSDDGLDDAADSDLIVGGWI